jgi:O-antigen ligase
MLARRGAAPLLALWRDARPAERLGAALLVAWLGLSVVQLLLAGNRVAAAEGLRLSQGYVAAGVLGGALWWSSADGPRRLPLLCAGLGAAAAYAVARIAIGPSGSEKTFALFGSDATSSFGSSFRAVGSFSGAFGLASMLAPAIVLLFALAVTRREGRWAYAAACVLAVVAVVGSQVRTGLVAAAVGIGFVALALLAERGLRSRRAVKLVVALGVLVALAGTGVAISSGGSSQVSRRATGLVSPLSDESVKIRLNTWRRTLDAAVAEPLGSGLGTVGRATGRSGATYTDNSYLKVLREQGFAGIALFLGAIVLLLGSLVGRLLRAGPGTRPFALAALAALITFLVMMVTGEYIEQPGKVLAWSLLGAALADLHVPRSPAAGAT